MFRIQVFDHMATMRWRDVAVINDVEAGVCWAFDDRAPLEHPTAEESVQVALQVTKNGDVATRVVNADTREVVFPKGSLESEK